MSAQSRSRIRLIHRPLDVAVVIVQLWCRAYQRRQVEAGASARAPTAEFIAVSNTEQIAAAVVALTAADAFGWDAGPRNAFVQGCRRVAAAYRLVSFAVVVGLETRVAGCRGCKSVFEEPTLGRCQRMVRGKVGILSDPQTVLFEGSLRNERSAPTASPRNWRPTTAWNNMNESIIHLEMRKLAMTAIVSVRTSKDLGREVGRQGPRRDFGNAYSVPLSLQARHGRQSSSLPAAVSPECESWRR